jgi:hypothetical protein
VNANPQFANLPQWNFQLQPNSPARNKGGNIGAYDIGAFQCAGGARR